MQNTSEGRTRMRPDELKNYLKSMHSDQPIKPTTKPQVINSVQPSSINTSKPKTINSEANDWKEKGNIEFKSGNYTAAIACYTSSIEAEPTCVAYANRAMAHLKLKTYDSAVEDCTSALKLDENYVKAYLRRGAAQRELGFLTEAINDFEAALRLEPGNKGALEDRKKCIEEWMEKNTMNKEIKIFSKTTSIPVVLAKKTKKAPLSTSSFSFTTQKPIITGDEGFLKQISTKRVSESNQQQGEEELIKKPVVQEIEILEENGEPYSLPKESKNIVDNPVESRVLESSELEAATSSLPEKQLTLQATSSFKAPKTGVDFERAWRGFKGNLVQQASYLRQINAYNLPVLLKQVLTPSLLVALQLTVLGPMLFPTDILADALAEEESSEIKNNSKTAASILEALPKMPRFGMNVLSVSSAQKNELRAAWEKACEAYPELLNPLRPAYSI